MDIIFLPKCAEYIYVSSIHDTHKGMSWVCIKEKKERKKFLCVAYVYIIWRESDVLSLKPLCRCICVTIKKQGDYQSTLSPLKDFLCDSLS